MTIKRLILSTLILLLLASCSQGKSGKTGRILVGFPIYNYADPFMTEMREATSRAAEGEAMVLFEDSQNQQSIQNDIIDSMIEERVDVLVVNLVDTSAAADVAAKAKEHNTPVIFINREPDHTVIENWDKAYYIGTRATESGAMSVEILLDYFKQNKEADLNGDGVIEYVAVMGEPGHQDTVLRTQAYIDTFLLSRANGGMGGREMFRFSGMWASDIAQEQMTGLLERTAPGQIEAILSNNDAMALGVIEALKKVGYFGQSGRYMPIVGVDAISGGMEALQNGTLLGTVLNDVVSHGSDAIIIATSLATGQKPAQFVSNPLTRVDGTGWGRFLWLPYRKITRENYRSFLPVSNNTHSKK